MFALVDANNFFVSCERVFQPELHNRPAIVLSNNDGCAIARSNESKALGITMGAPLHKIQDIIKKHGVHVRSANFTLYGDMSDRFMSVIESQSPNIEVYSIDEAFVEMGNYRDIDNWANNLQETTFKHTGLPSSIGVGRTKVLAKLANKIAKKSKGVSIIRPDDERSILAVTPVADIWGIGRRTSEKLMSMGVYTALQLIQTDKALIRKTFSIVMTRIQDELRGHSVLPLDMIEEPRQQILVSRSFGEPVKDIDQIRLAIARFIEEGSRKLRRQNSEVRELSVMMNTNRFSKVEKQYHRSSKVLLPCSSDNTHYLNKYAQELVTQIYRDGFNYKRAGIVLANLTPKGRQQIDLLNNRKDSGIDQVKDKINQRYGKAVIQPASLFSNHQQWKMKREHLSRQYTTNWSHLAEVY